MEESVKGKRFSSGAIIAGLVTLTTIVGGVVAIATWGVPLWQARRNVVGSWTLKTHTISSTDTSYKGMELTYTVNFLQEGSTIHGTGYKLGQQLAGGEYTAYPPTAQTPIRLEATLDGDSLTANFTEIGAIRSTSGQFQWQCKGESWAGTFSAEAAESSGTTSLTRTTKGCG